MISRSDSFKDAVATIRRTTVEFQYQLIITRAYEEGEAELLDLDAESTFQPSSHVTPDVFALATQLTPLCFSLRISAAEDERSFLIDPSLSFRPTTFDGSPSFVWADLSSSLSSSTSSPSPPSSPHLSPSDPEETDLFEFIVDDSQVSTRDCETFDDVVRRCMFERKFGRSATEASKAELESLKWVEPVRTYPTLPRLASTTATPVKKAAPPPTQRNEAVEEVEQELAQMTVNQTPVRPSAAAAAASPAVVRDSSTDQQVKAIIPAKAEEEELSEELPVIYSGSAEIYLFDTETEYFVVQGKVRVLVIEKNDRPFDCEYSPFDLARLRGTDSLPTDDWFCRLVCLSARGHGRVHHCPAHRGRHEHSVVSGGSRIYVELQSVSPLLLPLPPPPPSQSILTFLLTSLAISPRRRRPAVHHLVPALHHPCSLPRLQSRLQPLPLGAHQPARLGQGQGRRAEVRLLGL